MKKPRNIPRGFSRLLEKVVPLINFVMPAKAGIQQPIGINWIPVFTGMTAKGVEIVFQQIC